MRSGLWTRIAAAIGGACVVVATVLPWGTPNPFTSAHGAAIVGVNINSAAPFVGPYIGDFVRGGPVARGADAWHVATPLAFVLIAGSLVSVLVALTRLRRTRLAVVMAVIAATAIAVLTVLTWIHPPGFSLGPLRLHRSGAGEPLALAGAAVLVAALGVNLILDRPSTQDGSS